MNFVLEAEGDLAAALEAYSAKQLAPSKHADMNKRHFVISRFVTEGQVNRKTPLQHFIDAETTDDGDRALLQRWHHSFMGLFAIDSIDGETLHLTNWLTEKRYTVQLTSNTEAQQAARLKTSEILLAQLAPVSETEWLFLAPWVTLGKLGKPKLAVAIGSFKENYKPYLYGDAPDLLDAAWQSVEDYHQEFIEFFGGDVVSMSGEELSHKLSEFQQQTMQAKLQQAGLDGSKSLSDLAAEAGISSEELETAAQSMGANANVLNQAIAKTGTTGMALPQVELPVHLKRAESVTVMSHPRWGVVFVPTFQLLSTLLSSETWQTSLEAQDLLRQLIKDPDIKSFVVQQLAERYPTAVEALIQKIFQRPDFQVTTDLTALLEEYGKPVEPELPETASVPLHLHNLFQEVVVNLEKGKQKSKSKKKAVVGFQRA
ncbi:hypothetical protein ACQ4M4_21605 [Leptolyngbya sp. AN02str]|uniref:hypothetical protein n=1 Tax=Leptolyngbya sp. AN02str TaxID=3423363 RepID=UPI003D3134BB